MTSVDELIRTNILKFPASFPNRTTVLIHALLRGSWDEDGTLTYEIGTCFPLWNKEEKLAELEAGLKEDFKTEEQRQAVGEIRRKNLEAYAKVVEEVETRIHERNEEARIFSAQTPYDVSHAPIHNIPTNVTDDWAEACDEIKKIAEKSGWKF